MKKESQEWPIESNPLNSGVREAFEKTQQLLNDYRNYFANNSEDLELSAHQKPLDERAVDTLFDLHNKVSESYKELSAAEVEKMKDMLGEMFLYFLNNDLGNDKILGLIDNIGDMLEARGQIFQRNEIAEVLEKGHVSNEKTVAASRALSVLTDEFSVPDLKNASAKRKIAAYEALRVFVEEVALEEVSEEDLLALDQSIKMTLLLIEPPVGNVVQGVTFGQLLEKASARIFYFMNSKLKPKTYQH
jgi:hypothetical protein